MEIATINTKTNKTAVILIGQIRVDSPARHLWWESLKLQLNKYDVYVATYKSYQDRALEVSNKLYLLDDTSKTAIDFLGLSPSVETNDPNTPKRFSGLWQHYLLREVIEQYSDELKTYDNIIKIRNDALFDIDSIKQNISNSPESFHVCTDFIFGAKSDLFLKCFYEHNFLDFLKLTWNKDKSYIDINYKHLNQSLLLPLGNKKKSKDKNTFKWNWLNFNQVSGNNWKNIVEHIQTKSEANQPTINDFKIIEMPVLTQKKFWTAFSSEKQLVNYLLFFAPFKSVEGIINFNIVDLSVHLMAVSKKEGNNADPMLYMAEEVVRLSNDKWYLFGKSISEAKVIIRIKKKFTKLKTISKRSD